MSVRTATLDPGLRLAAVLGAWLTAAVILGGSGVLGRAPILVPLIACGTLIAGLVIEQRTGALRAIEPRRLIAMHLIRVPIGAALLVEMSRGNLPELFAKRAGVGDVAIGLAAVGLLAWPRRDAVFVWSLLGIAELLIAAGAARYLLFAVPDPRMQAFGALPYALLSLFVVPFLVLTHVALIRGPR